jgi:hypothetical protein
VLSELQHVSSIRRMLKAQLEALRRKNVVSSGTSGYYIPNLLLYPILTLEAIEETLQSSGSRPQQREEIARMVELQARKTFAILVLLDQVNHIFKFAEAQELQDSRLPFTIGNLTEYVNLPQSHAKKFEEKQWEMLAATFQRGTINTRFRKDIVLPFVKDKCVNSSGGFGVVYASSLDPDHQQLGKEFPMEVGTY